MNNKRKEKIRLLKELRSIDRRLSHFGTSGAVEGQSRNKQLQPTTEEKERRFVSNNLSHIIAQGLLLDNTGDNAVTSRTEVENQRVNVENLKIKESDDYIPIKYGNWKDQRLKNIIYCYIFPHPSKLQEKIHIQCDYILSTNLKKMNTQDILEDFVMDPVEDLENFLPIVISFHLAFPRQIGYITPDPIIFNHWCCFDNVIECDEIFNMFHYINPAYNHKCMLPR